jgi:hypothetical protein
MLTYDLLMSLLRKVGANSHMDLIRVEAQVFSFVFSRKQSLLATKYDEKSRKCFNFLQYFCYKKQNFPQKAKIKTFRFNP